jgi:hypothetical protein
MVFQARKSFVRAHGRKPRAPELIDAFQRVASGTGIAAAHGMPSTQGGSAMTPSQIRDELLSQHESLRARLEATRAVVDRWAKGEVPQAHVRTELAGLSDALRSHNLVEERTLRELIRNVDAWGPVRVEIMDESHVDEHRDLFDALHVISLAHDGREALQELERFRARLLAHMDREEAGFLNASVLRDDQVVIDAQGG